MIEFVKPTIDMIKIIADDMRKSDAVEVMASHGHTPIEALKVSFKCSGYSSIAVADGVPFSMFGVTMSNITTGLGYPWLLSSNEVFKHKEYFLKNAPSVLEDIIFICPRLVNYVHHENKTSIKWLRSLGFTIEDPEPYGVKEELFHKFHMGVI